eukprot:COSAG01_NODE_829_length_13273_cov_7.729695_13_plen_47_part_00
MDPAGVPTVCFIRNDQQCPHMRQYGSQARFRAGFFDSYHRHRIKKN